MEQQVFSVEKYAQTAREAVAEGIVMLQNNGGVLPLAKKSRIALFGRSQFCYYKSGTGSGGLVNTAYVTGIAEAFEKDGRYELNQNLKAIYEEWLKDHPFDTGSGWAQEPWFQEEMPLSKEVVAKIREESDTAVIIIGRTAGEDKDNLATEGSYLLTGAEEAMLENICGVFERSIVLLNVGNIIDMKWVEKYKPAALLYVWQGGQEGGNGVVDVLSGDISPSGRLSDTIAYDIEDYPSTKYYGDSIRNFYAEDIYVGYRYFSTFAPEKVLYPFGYGLSYTDFALQASLAQGGDLTQNIAVDVQITNTGAYAGKEVVQVFCQAPQGLLGKAKRSLCGFAKTDTLSPGEKQSLTIEIPVQYLVSYDDGGVTGHKSCNVLEAGEYVFYAGENVRDAREAGRLTLDETKVIEELEEALAPVRAFSHMKPGECKEDGTYLLAWQDTPLRTADPGQRRVERLPEEYAYTGDQGYKLADVESGKVSMAQFLAQLTDEELCCIVRGEGMCSPKVTPGTAAAFGGVTENLQNYGIPVGCCADGPSGIRMDCGTIAFSMPNGTCLACTFNEELVQRLYEWEGLELRKNRIDTLLGPGMNIHRNPLNGRNFEYFSEDPLLTGKMVAAQLKGMHKYDVTGTIKHFACNNQEHSRNFAEAVVSERALREIYLKGFEIAVKEGGARSIMSTYGPVNGFWTAGAYDLLTTILRKEWGYKGIVMTDWWAKANDENEEATLKNTAAMVRGQNDLYMVTGDSLSNANGDNSQESLQKGTVARGEFQRCAANICRYLLTTPAYLRMQDRETELDKALQKYAEQENSATGRILCIDGENPLIDTVMIDTAKGKSTTLQITVKERGLYRLEFSCKAAEGTGELAQLPLSVFQDKKLVETVTLSGADTTWQKKIIEFPIPLFSYTFYVKLFFGMSGMEIKDMKVVMSKSMEEEIRQAMLRRKEQSPEE
ncbi:MAG: glycoside hydrolase family 3 C-terminal domain-containing protein [Ruminococcus sp.]|nr:glycoside hydrolase family 3 C-terminal domain-containing protein [Ruminococcus sp.]